MKPTNSNKRLWAWLGGIAAYLLALGLLTWVERADPDASIQTYADAFWYSVVTMSTVGYGDLYPVTALGKVLGIGFVLLSVGLLTFLISVLIRVITGKMLPAVQLWRVRNRPWYLFSCQNGAAFALAEDLVRQEPDCVLLFPECGDSTPPEQLPCLTYSGSLEALAARKKDHCSLIFISETDEYEQAVAALQTGHPVYCRTEYAPDTCPENLTLFDACDCCAQSYWQAHGLTQEEKTVLLIGDGKYARDLLTRGLLLNVFSARRTTAYHVFGDWSDYRRNHHQLGATLCINGTAEGQDSLFFHADAWNQDPALLAEADRVILCSDDRAQNMALLGQIHRYFPVHAQVHMLCDRAIPGITVFGTQDTIYTAELVLGQQLTYAARAMHRIYRDSTGGSAPQWGQLSEFLRQSNVAAAGHLLTKIRILLADDSISAITPEKCREAFNRYQKADPEQKECFRWIEHQRWLRFHSMYNWRYAPQRNNPAREHPLMVPFEQLDHNEQIKDDYAWELLETLSQKLGN